MHVVKLIYNNSNWKSAFQEQSRYSFNYRNPLFQMGHPSNSFNWSFSKEGHWYWNKIYNMFSLLASYKLLIK